MMVRLPNVDEIVRRARIAPELVTASTTLADLAVWREAVAGHLDEYIAKSRNVVFERG